MLKTTGLRLIQIGVTGDERLLGVDDFLQNQSFRQIEKLIDDCRSWIGVDNFLQHLCHCRPVTPKGIVLWGISDPQLFGYEYNLNVIGKRLRPDQFGTWQIEPDPSVFWDAEEVFKRIQLFIKGN
jgi:hypothetical protein